MSTPETPEEPRSADDGTPAEGAQVSEAEAELAAQRLERERIERRKAERQGPIEAGTKLSGTAAELLAAVRAVESGEKPPRPLLAGRGEETLGICHGRLPCVRGGQAVRRR
ncbi:hypothetical protein ACWDRY_33225, partial [Streptomyces cellulosae]